MLRRLYQTHAHPQLFRQTIQLTDGSTVRIVSVSGKRPFLKVGVDAMSHPTWNPRLRSELMLTENAEVSKFKERYEDVTGDSSLSDFDGLVGVLLNDKKGREGASDSRPTAKSAAAGKAKKK